MDTAAPRCRVARGAPTLLAILALLFLFAAPALADFACPARPGAQPIRLPHLRSAISNGIEAVIVALGSSSTKGTMASDLAHSYPAVLQQALSTGLPEAHVAVINRGIGGQDAREELARMPTDVVAVRPQVVIWQVGANAALRNVDPASFRALVAAGVRRMQEAGSDVILMDNQQSPRLLAQTEEPVLDEELAEVAAETGAALFSRRALMRTWRSEGTELAQFIAPDGLHHNDRGYFCVAEALAESILAGTKQVHQPLTAALSLPAPAAR